MPCVQIDRSVIDSYLAVEDGYGVVKDLMGMFLTSVPQRLSAAKTAILDNKISEAARYVHSIKNSFLNVGAISAANECQSLEDRLLKITFAERIKEINSISCLFRETLKELEELDIAR